MVQKVPLLSARARGYKTRQFNYSRSGWDMMPSSIDEGTIVELRVKYVNVAYGRRCNQQSFEKNLALLNFDDERKPNLEMPSMLNVGEYGTHYGLNGRGARRLKCQTTGTHCPVLAGSMSVPIFFHMISLPLPVASSHA